MVRRFLCALSVAILILGANSHPSFADMEEALQAMSDKDHAAVLKELMPLVERGDLMAQRLLGHWYIHSANGDQSMNRAGFELLLPFAENGDSYMQWLIGSMFHQGLGVKRDYGQAMYWLRKSADQDYGDAYYFVGEMFARGKGVPEDKAEAARWYLLAANVSDIHAQYRLGIMRMQGDGISHDLVLAHRWLRLSAAGGYDKARFALRNLQEIITPEQIAEAERDGKDWLDNRGDATKRYFADFHDLEKLLTAPDAPE